MQSRRMRVVICAISAAVLGAAVIAYCGVWRNPLLPDSSWLTLETASTDNSQSARVRVAPDKRVNLPEDGLQYWECDLAVDPRDPSRLFAATLECT